MSKYRTATPQEIAKCIRLQVVDACDVAEQDEYRTRPAKLRSLIRDIRVCAKSSADWLASQRPAGEAQPAVEMRIDCQLLAEQIHAVSDQMQGEASDGLLDLLCAIEMHARRGALIKLVDATPAN